MCWCSDVVSSHLKTIRKLPGETDAFEPQTLGWLKEKLASSEVFKCDGGAYFIGCFQRWLLAALVC